MKKTATQSDELITMAKKIQTMMQELTDMYDEVSENGQEFIDAAVACLSDAESYIKQIN